MAETAGLVLGAISLAALFSTCIELSENIDLARNQGKGYENCSTKFSLLKSRLKAWGESMNILQSGNENQMLRQRWKGERDTVEKALSNIKGILEDARGLEVRYGQAQHGEQLAVIHGASGSTAGLEDVEHGPMISTEERQKQQVSWRRRVGWAVRDKKVFDELINNFAFYMDNLELMAKRLRVRDLQSSTSTDVVTSPAAARRLLVEPTVGSEETLSVASSPGLSSTQSTTTPGHVYMRNKAKEKAKVVSGNIGLALGGGFQHQFWENEYSGDAMVIQGDMSAGAMRDFFKLREQLKSPG